MTKNFTFSEWESNTHIPQKVMNMVNAIAKQVGCGEVEEETIYVYNIYGYIVGYAKGFALTHCTYNLSDGASPDYSSEMEMWLKGLDFSIENSYGDNGKLSNGRDCYWWDEFIYNPSKVWKEAFRKK